MSENNDGGSGAHGALIVMSDLYTASSGAYTTAVKLAAAMRAKGFKTTADQAKAFILSTKSGVSLQIKRGVGHFMPQYPGHQFQIDLVQIPGPQSQPMHLIAVDIASRRMAAVPIQNKTQGVLATAFKKIITEMGGAPETLYSDQESGFRESPEGKGHHTYILEVWSRISHRKRYWTCSPTDNTRQGSTKRRWINSWQAVRQSPGLYKTSQRQ
jgi:hypothetical protein